MERADEQLVLELSEKDPNLKKLYDQHKKLEKEVARFSRYASYSPSAALRANELKKEKLRGMDDIMHTLRRYRHDHDHSDRL